MSFQPLSVIIASLTAVYLEFSSSSTMNHDQVELNPLLGSGKLDIERHHGEDGSGSESSFIESDQVWASMVDRMLLDNAPKELKDRFKHSKNQSNAQEVIELIKQHLNSEGKTYDEVMRKEILEYIAKGFESIYKEIKGDEGKKDGLGLILKGGQEEHKEEIKDVSWF